MSSVRLNHIAVAVNDIEQGRKTFAGLFGVTPGDVMEVPDQKVKVCFLKLGEINIELVAPLPENESLKKFLAKRGEGLHHIAVGVSDIEATLESYRKSGVRLIDEIPRVGAQGHRIAFVHPGSASGVLIELEESD